MREYRFFVDTYDDLRERVEGERDEYRLLRGAGLIRQLLIDENPLALRVNETLRLPLRFRITRSSPLTEVAGDPAMLWTNPYPFDLPAETVKLDRLRRATVLSVEGRPFTVDQVVKVCANKLGGVHYDDKNVAAEKVLIEFNEALVINGIGSLVETVAGIGAVTLTGLEELYAECRRLS